MLTAIDHGGNMPRHVPGRMYPNGIFSNLLHVGGCTQPEPASAGFSQVLLLGRNLSGSRGARGDSPTRRCGCDGMIFGDKKTAQTQKTADQNEKL